MDKKQRRQLRGWEESRGLRALVSASGPNTYPLTVRV